MATGNTGAIVRRGITHDTPAYGRWSLVIINSALFLFFALSFFKPRTVTDWRTFGTFSAFIVALFVEMYGFPLTIYLLYPWLVSRFPGVDPLSHDFGHLWSPLLGLAGDPHVNPIHLASNVVILLGFWLLASAWKVLYEPSARRRLRRADRTRGSVIRSTRRSS
jgi:hypothetical protein